jgi:signal recognition particle GTPase
MDKTQNRKIYKHNIDLIKYSEDGERKRCILCVEEKEPHEISSKTSYCKPCWADYMRCKRNGTLDMLKEQYAPKWEVLREKYKDVKKCNTCLEIKPKVEFYPDKKAPHGYQNKCISCVKEYNRTSNKYLNPLNKQKHKEYQEKHKERWKQLKKEAYANNIQYRITQTLRDRLYKAIKNEWKNESAIKLLGCSIEEFKLHLEKHFSPEMSWKNHGKIWEIDHIVGCANFNMENLEEQKKCFHYTNMQPLFKTSDIAKSFGYVDHIGNRNKPKKY